MVCLNVPGKACQKFSCGCRGPALHVLGVLDTWFTQQSHRVALAERTACTSLCRGDGPFHDTSLTVSFEVLLSWIPCVLPSSQRQKLLQWLLQSMPACCTKLAPECAPGQELPQQFETAVCGTRCLVHVFQACACIAVKGAVHITGITRLKHGQCTTCVLYKRGIHQEGL